MNKKGRKKNKNKKTRAPIVPLKLGPREAMRLQLAATDTLAFRFMELGAETKISLDKTVVATHTLLTTNPLRYPVVRAQLRALRTYIRRWRRWWRAKQLQWEKERREHERNEYMRRAQEAIRAARMAQQLLEEQRRVRRAARQTGLDSSSVNGRNDEDDDRVEDEEDSDFYSSSDEEFSDDDLDVDEDGVKVTTLTKEDFLAEELARLQALMTVPTKEDEESEDSEEDSEDEDVEGDGSSAILNALAKLDGAGASSVAECDISATDTSVDESVDVSIASHMPLTSSSSSKKFSSPASGGLRPAYVANPMRVPTPPPLPSTSLWETTPNASLSGTHSVITATPVPPVGFSIAAAAAAAAATSSTGVSD